MLPKVVTEIAFTTDPGSTSPAWTDVSAYVKRCNPIRGREDEYSDFQPGTNSLTLRNDDRRFDPTYAAGPYYPNVVPMRRVRQYVEGPLIGTEFWGDFEAGADGTAPEWTAMNGLLECKAGAEARQLQFKTTPTPRLGARIGRFEVASGDQFGATSGERCEVRRGTPNGGFGTGNLEGLTVYTQFSTRFLAPWTLTGEGIFQQTHDSGSTYGSPFFRWRMGSSANFEFRVVTGAYPNSTDAGNGVNAGTSFTHTGLAFATDQWFDFRHAIYYTTSDTGWYVAQMKTDVSSTWTTVASMGSVATLPSYPGSGATSQFDKLGFYRGTPQASTNVVFHDGYQIGHGWQDVSYSGFSTDSRWNDKGWEGREQAAAQVGNPDFEADITGTASAGGGTTTRTWDTTRAKFGSGSLKMVTNGAASGQGAFHTKRSLSRYDGIVAGKTYTASAWFSGDGFEQVRIGIEWFDSGGSSISTTFNPGRALRTDFRRHYLTAVAPANAVTMRIRTSLTGTNAATFWVDGVDWWEGEMNHTLFEGYVDSWEMGYPDRLFQSESVAHCTDARSFLAQVAQPITDPPFDSYDGVISYSQPSFYYRLGEPEGTKVVSHVRKRKHRYSVGGAYGFTRTTKRRWKTTETRAEVEGVSGPSGTYKNNPTLGEPGAITGDPDTSVRFTRADAEYARISMDAETSETVAGNRLTVEVWVKLAANTVNNNIILGGPQKADTTNVWNLFTGDALDRVGWQVADNTGGSKLIFGTTTLTAGTWYHVVATWSSGSQRIYVNGVLEKQADPGGVSIATPAASSAIYIAEGIPGTTNSFDGWIDEVAIYEKVLEPATILRHYEAGLRGYNQQGTGARVSAVLSSVTVPLLSQVDAGTRSVLPTRQFGQGTMDPIDDAVAAEGGFSGFFFTGSGVARYLGRDYRDVYPYSANQATFDTDPSQGLPYDDLGFTHGGQYLASRVRVTADGGTLQEVTDSASVSRFALSSDSPITLEQSGAPMVSDNDALTEANWLLGRSADPRWRITAVTFPSDAIEGFDRMQQALNREIGDGITIKNRPKGGTVYSQFSAIEHVSHDIDFEGRTWNTTYGVSPVADDLSTGWVLSVPGQTELDSTAVLN